MNEKELSFKEGRGEKKEKTTETERVTKGEGEKNKGMRQRK